MEKNKYSVTVNQEDFRGEDMIWIHFEGATVHISFGLQDEDVGQVDITVWKNNKFYPKRTKLQTLSYLSDES